MHNPIHPRRAQTGLSKCDLLCSLALLCVFFWFTPALRAQIDSGGLTGTVTDSTGAVVPGVQVKLTNQATGIVTTIPSGKSGTYSFEALRPGTYTLQVGAAGFKTFSSQGVDIHVQQIATVDVHLQPGTVDEQVTVTAATPLLQAETSAVGQTIEGKAVNDLPLNGRNWASLGQLAAGVTTTTTALGGTAGSSGSPFFSVNGVNYWQNDFRLDGIDDNIEFYGGSQVGSNASITPPPDAIQEFKLQNGDFTAEFGHSTGGVVNAVVKSGGNALHGDVWEYLRNNAVDAIPYFSAGNAEYRQNQFGGTVGGPIVIPHLYDGRDKTFFFFDYQGLRVIQPFPTTSTVPTPLMQSSDFQNLQDLITYNPGTYTDALGRTASLGTVYDPATTRSVAAGAVDPVSGLTNTSSSAVSVRDPFYTGGSVAGITNFTTHTSQLNQMPAGRLDPNAIKLLQLYPAATNASTFSNNYSQNGRSTTTENQIDFRVDQNFSSRDILFGVFDWQHYLLFEPPSLPGIADGQNFGTGNNDSPHYAIAIGYTHLFTPTLTNEFRFGYDHNIDNVIAPEGGTLGVPAEYGIDGVPQVPGNGGLPAINIGALSGLGVAPYVPTIRTIKSLELSDNVTKVLNTHTIKSGYQIDILEGDITQPPYGRGSFTYSGQYSSAPNLGNQATGIADALLVPTPSTVGGTVNEGGLSSFSGSNFSAVNDKRYYMGAYLQDDWKATPKLTLNLGVRWDLTTPYFETTGRQANFIASGGDGPGATFYLPNKTCGAPRSASFNSLLATDGIALACVPGLNVGNAQHKNFSPRIGFAYRFRENMVIRGGYGIAYGALDNVGFGGTLGTNYPFQYSLSFNSPNSTSPLVLSNGQTATVENSLSVVNLQNPALVTGSGISLIGRQYDFQTPYTETYNLTYQYQFTPHDSAQVAYVGTLGRHLDIEGSTNSPSQLVAPGASIYSYIPFPDFSPNSSYLSTNGQSNYNSLQTVYARQVATGFSVLFNYTYSKCMTDQHAQSGSFPSYRAEWLPGFGIQGDTSLCDTDATHVIHASGTWQLPVGRGQTYLRAANRVVDAVLGGWSANYIFTHQSGQPFTINCPFSTTAFFGCDADVVRGANIYAGPHDRTQWLNPLAFAQPPTQGPGVPGFASLGGEPQQARGPELNDLDASLFKEFALYEKTRLQFRAEAFNLSNTPQFSNPGSLNFASVASGSVNPSNPVVGNGSYPFSSITSTRTATSQRVLQFALKLFY